jgi:hypothetical protein
MSSDAVFERNLLYCQIVAQLLIVDAAVTDAERDFLERLMNRFGFDKAQKQAVFDGVDIGEPIDTKLTLLDDASRTQLLGELEAAAAVDGEIDEGELEIIDQVRRAIGQATN